MPVNDDPCPLCGGRVTYRGLVAIECVTDGCGNCPPRDAIYHAGDLMGDLRFWYPGLD